MSNQKKLTRQRIGKVGEVILLGVAAVGVVSIALFAPNMLQVLNPLLKDKKYSHKRSVTNNIESLVHGGMLRKVTNAHGKISLEITARGKWEAFIRSEKIRTQTREKWDGEWRVIVFDIPNSKKNTRSELRRAIGLFGFKQLQRSVWVYPYQCDDFIALLKKYLGVTEDVLVMKVAHIEGDKELRREFKLH